MKTIDTVKEVNQTSDNYSPNFSKLVFLYLIRNQYNVQKEGRKQKTGLKNGTHHIHTSETFNIWTSYLKIKENNK